MKISWWVTFTERSNKFLEIVLSSMVKDCFSSCSPRTGFELNESRAVDLARITRLILTLYNRIYPPQESFQTLFFCEAQRWIKRLLTAVIYITFYLSCVAKNCIQLRLFKHFFARRSIVSITNIALAELILLQLSAFMLLCRCPHSIIL